MHLPCCMEATGYKTINNPNLHVILPLELEH